MERHVDRLIGRAERALRREAPVILMYHRVAPTEDDVWGVCIEPKRFGEQIQALKTVRDVVALDKLPAAMSDTRRTKPLAVVTFDDGYHDALTTALPMLERLGCPATVYVTTGVVATGKPFWWDELARLVTTLPTEIAPPLELTIGQKQVTWKVPDDDKGRRRVCRQLRRLLRDMTPEQIDAQLEVVAAWARTERGGRPEDRAMTPEEVGQLSQSLVTVGAHTVRHPSLPTLSPETQLAEISESRQACEAWIGKPVEHFAYPFGHYNRASVRAAAEAEFVSACTTNPGVVGPWTDPLRLPRITPGTMDGEALAKLLAPPKKK